MRTNTIHSVSASSDCRPLARDLAPNPSWNLAWDEDDLIQRLCQTLDLTERAIRQLESPDTANEIPSRALDQADSFVSEAAILLLAASNVDSYAAIGPRILRVAALLVPHARSQRVQRRICLEPAHAFEYATAHICLKRLGFYDCDLDALLDLAAASQAFDGHERTAHRMMQQDWLRQGWLYPEGMRRMRCGSHVAASALGRSIDLLHGSRADIQSFTRALLYVTDLNLFPRPLPRSRDLLLADAEAMLALALDQQEYDLAAEILIAWPLTGESWSPAAAFAFRILTRNADLIGDDPLDLTGRTLFSMGCLYAIALTGRRLPPLHIPHRAMRTGTLDAVLDLIPLDADASGWEEEWQQLDPAERHSLSEFLLATALHRAFGRRDFTAMQHQLEVSRALGLAQGPLTYQAAELLTRVNRLTGSCDCTRSLQPSDIPVCA